MPSSSKFEIQDIGNTLVLREEIDAGHKVTNWFRQGLNVVDLVPAKFKLDFFKEGSTVPTFEIYNYGDDGQDIEDPLHIYSDPSKIFKNKCTAYKLKPVTALRLWITGESTFQEEISNEYSQNLLESQINGVVQKIAGPSPGSITNVIKQGILSGSSSGQSRSGLTRAANNVIDNLAKTAGSAVTAVIGDSNYASGAIEAVKKIGHLFVNNTLQYSMLSIPKTFSSSSYNPSLSFNIRLISPYGHPDAIQQFIINPLTYLLLLSTPTTKDGLTYGGVSYVTAKAYGIADMPLAIMDNLSIRRGGADVAYNKYRQPLSIDVNISIKPAATGIASYLDHFESSNLNSNETNYNDGVKVAKDIASPTTGTDFNANTTGDSPMTTIGNMLESFKPMDAYGSNPGESSSAVTTSKLLTSSSQQATIKRAKNNAAKKAESDKRKHYAKSMQTAQQNSRRI